MYSLTLTRTHTRVREDCAVSVVLLQDLSRGAEQSCSIVLLDYSGLVSLYVCMCVHLHYYFCEDINVFPQSHCGDSTSLWGQKLSPYNVNHDVLHDGRFIF